MKETTKTGIMAALLITAIVCSIIGTIKSFPANPVAEARKTFHLKHEAEVGLTDIYTMDVNGDKFVVWQAPQGIAIERTK